MDPNANLQEQLRLAGRLVDVEHVDEHDARRLSELVLALHEWVLGGGFMPEPWARRQA